MTKALADRLAEALAEALHRRAREEWGYGRDEALGFDDLIRERYRGIRPAPGYPASPDHTEKRTLFDLLDAERRSACASPRASPCTRPRRSAACTSRTPRPGTSRSAASAADQVEDYARRKRRTVEEMERWLAPWLAYDPVRTATPR